VIPAYNRTEDLTKAVLSAVNQLNYSGKYEIVICDDTEDANCREGNYNAIKEISFPYLRYYRNSKRLGLYQNWNRCVELAQAKYIVMLHTDDWLSDGYLSKVFPIMQNHDEIDYLSVRPQNKLLNCFQHASCVPIPFQLTMIGGFFPVQCSIFKKKSILEFGGFLTKSSVDDLVFKKAFTFYYNVFLYNEELYFQNSNEESYSYKINWSELLVHEYYYDLNSVNKRNVLIQKILKEHLIYEKIGKVEAYNKGKNYFGRATEIDLKQFKECCSINGEKDNKLIRKMVSKIYEMDQKYYINKAIRCGIDV